MAFRTFITAQDLIDAISESTFMALFNDSNVGSVATVTGSTAVKNCLMRAHAEVASYLPRIYATMPPEVASGLVADTDGIPVLLKDAELKWATIYAYRRHKEYVRTYSAEPGGSLVKEVTDLMERIADLVQQIAPTDNAPAAKPGLPQSIAKDEGPRIIASDPNGTTNMGDF